MILVATGLDRAARLCRLGPAAAAALLAASTLASAQTFTGSAIPRPFTIPSSQLAPADPAPASATAPAAEPSAPAAASRREAPSSHDPSVRTPETRLQRLGALGSGWLIEGESGRLDWPVYISPSQDLSGARFRLSYRTDISVLPIASPVTVYVNGVRIGSSLEPAATRNRTVDLDVPARLLQPGSNAIRITAEQHHRVDCSVAATYELWTEVISGETGLILAGDVPPIVSVNDLAGLAPRRDGALPIRILVAGKLQPAAVDRALRAAQAVAIVSRTLHPIVDFGSAPAQDGIALLVGSDLETREARLELAGARELAPGLTLGLFPGSRAPTLVVSGPSEAGIDRAIAALAAKPLPVGSPEGRRLAGLRAGVTVSGGDALAFKALGQGTEAFNGRRLRLDLPINLPADFLPADYGQAIVSLTGSYARGLGPGSEILVRANGRDAASWPLNKTGGSSFARQSLPVPLGLLRPGPNSIEITAHLPDAPGGAACSAQPAGEPRLRLSDESRIVMPPLARIGRFPDLSAFTAGALPFDRDRRRARLVVPQPDRDSMAAAATAVARVAVSAGHIVPFAFSREQASEAGVDTLLVGPLRAVDPGMLRRVRVSPDAALGAWRGPAGGTGRPAGEPAITGALGRGRAEPAACEFSNAGAERGRAVPPTVEIVSLPAPEPAATWSQRLRASYDRVLRRVTSAAGATLDELAKLGSTTAVGAAESAPREDDVLAFAQGEAEDGGSLTVLTAPDAASLRAAVACVAGPSQWSRLSGRTAFLQRPDAELRIVETDRSSYFATQDFSFGNTRLIAAGWLSLHPAMFVGLALLIAGLLALSTTTLVRNVGRRQPA